MSRNISDFCQEKHTNYTTDLSYINNQSYEADDYLLMRYYRLFVVRYYDLWLLDILNFSLHCLTLDSSVQWNDLSLIAD